MEPEFVSQFDIFWPVQGSAYGVPMERHCFFTQSLRASFAGTTMPYVGDFTYHSKSLYIMVKKTWRKRFTAFISTARRYNHASPDIIVELRSNVERLQLIYFCCW